MDRILLERGLSAGNAGSDRHEGNSDAVIGIGRRNRRVRAIDNGNASGTRGRHSGGR